MEVFGGDRCTSSVLLSRDPGWHLGAQTPSKVSVSLCFFCGPKFPQLVRDWILMNASVFFILRAKISPLETGFL